MVDLIRTPPGLEGVIVAETALGGVRGDEGFFHYRDHAATELARSASLEGVWHLLYEGALPSAASLDRFRAEIGRARVLPPELMAAIADVARVGDGGPALAWVRTAVSLVAQHLELRPWLDRDARSRREEAMSLAATLPSVVAIGWRARSGAAPIAANASLPVTYDFLRMLTGMTPDPSTVAALERYLILTIDHGFNASTFASRVVTSTGADFGSGIVAGIGALSGPLHGGAPVHVLEMLEAIGRPEHAAGWIRQTLAGGGRLMGFGHRVYRTEDPRSVLLRSTAVEFDDPLVTLAIAVEATALRLLAEHRPDRDLRTNVEYYAGVVLHLAGIPAPLFPACFAISRSIGWTAHMLEQASTNRIIRPEAAYSGPPPHEVEPLRSPTPSRGECESGA